jgi:endonuclease YncB( thermonuclease family)
VFAVLSGDWIVVFDHESEYWKVKLHGIRSPAANTPAGRIARGHLHMLLAGKFVTVNYRSISPQGDIDGTVLHGGDDVNLRMLEAGMARINNRITTPEILQRYQSAESRAQARGLGIWKADWLRN